jgi:hypothetical protein
MRVKIFKNYAKRLAMKNRRPACAGPLKDEFENYPVLQ